MLRAKQVITLCLTLFGFVFLQAEEIKETPSIKERPRVYLGPYNDLVLDSYYRGWGYSSYYYPFFSPLMYHSYVPPGRSSVTFAVGSNGYMGTAFSTSDRIKGTHLIYSISTSWERGESYYSGADYQLSTISGALMWANENTSIVLGFDVSELSLDDKAFIQKERPRVISGPLRSGIPLTRDLNPTLDYHSVNLGLSQRIGDHTHLFFSIVEDVFDQDEVSVGLSTSLWDSSIGKRR